MTRRPRSDRQPSVVTTTDPDAAMVAAGVVAPPADTSDQRQANMAHDWLRVRGGAGSIVDGKVIAHGETANTDISIWQMLHTAGRVLIEQNTIRIIAC